MTTIHRIPLGPWGSHGCGFTALAQGHKVLRVEGACSHCGDQPLWLGSLRAAVERQGANKVFKDLDR